MRKKIQTLRRHTQRGAIAVEAAFSFMILATFLTVPSVFWTFYFYKYSAAQKAVHDAALYLSTAPKLEMAAAGPDGRPAALTVARAIISREMAGLNPPDPDIICAYQQASGAVVSKSCSTTNNQAYNQSLVQLTVSMDMSYVDPMTGADSGFWISPYADVHYLGN